MNSRDFDELYAVVDRVCGAQNASNSTQAPDSKHETSGALDRCEAVCDSRDLHSPRCNKPCLPGSNCCELHHIEF